MTSLIEKAAIERNEKWEYRIYGCVISQVVILKSELEKVKILGLSGNLEILKFDWYSYVWNSEEIFMWKWYNICIVQFYTDDYNVETKDHKNCNILICLKSTTPYILEINFNIKLVN